MLRRWPTSVSAQGGSADHCMGSPGPHPSPLQGNFPIVHFGHTTTPGNLKLPWGDPHGGEVPPDLLSPCGEPKAPPRVDQGEVPKYPRSGPIGVHCWGGAC